MADDFNDPIDDLFDCLKDDDPLLASLNGQPNGRP